MIYLLGAAIIAARFGRGPAVMSAIINVAAFDFFFVPPFFSFAVSDTQYLVTFAVMLAVTLIIGNLTASVRLQARVAGHRERRTASLYAMSRELAGARGAENLATIAVRHTSEVFDSQVVVLLPDADGRIAHPRGASLPGSLRGADLSVAQWVFDHAQNAGLGTDTLPGSDAIYLPLKSTGTAPDETGAKKSTAPPAPALGVLALLPANPRRVLLPEQLHLLETFAGQVALALERVHLADQAHQAAIHAENERMRNALLSAISHDLRTPLAVIAGSASTLVEGAAALPESKRKEMAQAIYDQAQADDAAGEQHPRHDALRNRRAATEPAMAAAGGNRRRGAEPDAGRPAGTQSGGGPAGGSAAGAGRWRADRAGVVQPARKRGQIHPARIADRDRGLGRRRGDHSKRGGSRAPASIRATRSGCSRNSTAASRRAQSAAPAWA